MVKSTLFKIIVLSLISLSISQLSTAAESNQKIKIGIFSFSVSETGTWTPTQAAMKKAAEILKFENVNLEPTFAIENGSGKMIYGTWKELRAESTITAETLSDGIPAFPEEWGLKNPKLENYTGTSKSGFEYAFLRVLGQGDGKIFGKNKPKKTVGIWIDMPIKYEDSSGISRQALISLYYRGIEEKETFGIHSPDENFIKIILDNFSTDRKLLRSGYNPSQTPTAPASKVVNSPSLATKTDPEVSAARQPSYGNEVVIAAKNADSSKIESSNAQTAGEAAPRTSQNAAITHTALSDLSRAKADHARELLELKGQLDQKNSQLLALEARQSNIDTVATKQIQDFQTALNAAKAEALREKEAASRAMQDAVIARKTLSAISAEQTESAKGLRELKGQLDQKTAQLVALETKQASIDAGTTNQNQDFQTALNVAKAEASREKEAALRAMQDTTSAKKELSGISAEYRESIKALNELKGELEAKNKRLIVLQLALERLSKQSGKSILPTESVETPASEYQRLRASRDTISSSAKPTALTELVRTINKSAKVNNLIITSEVASMEEVAGEIIKNYNEYGRCVDNVKTWTQWYSNIKWVSQ